MCLWLPLQATAQTPVERALDATLVLFSSDLDRAFLGSGFVIGEAGLALSNAHVVGDAAEVRVRYRDGQEGVARVLARDERRDIAVLQLPAPMQGLMLAPAGVDIGTEVFALGAPLELGFTVSRGIVSAAPRQIDPTVPLRFIQHDAAVNPGSSGGPLVDGQGWLAGMNSQIADGSRLFVGVAYAIGADDLAVLVPRMLAGELRPVPQLGIEARRVTAKIAAALGIAETGLLVDNVLPEGAAARAGLRAGDVLLSLNGAPLPDPGALGFALATADPATARLDILRDGTRRGTALRLAQPAPVAVSSPSIPAPRSLADLSVTLDDANGVAALPPDSPAAIGGLVLGDIILRMNGQPPNPGFDRLKHGKPFVLLVRRDGRSLHLVIDPHGTAHALLRLGQGNALDLAVRRF